MENHDHHSTYAGEVAAALNDDDLSLVDFDRLKQWLTEVAPVLNQCHRLREEHEVLRKDYIGRIAGMVKAIAAANRRSEGWESALDYVDNLKSLSAPDLIEQYRKTSARFRDAFPTSLAPVPGRKRGGFGRKDAGMFTRA